MFKTMIKFDIKFRNYISLEIIRSNILPIIQIVFKS